MHHFHFSYIEFQGFIKSVLFLGGHTFKYKPKPRVRTEKENFSTDLPQPDAIGSVMHPPDPQFVSSETACMPDGSIPFSDYVLDYSSIDLGDIIPSDPTTSELPMNVELTNLSETSHANTSNSGDVSRMAKKLVIFCIKNYVYGLCFFHR